MSDKVKPIHASDSSSSLKSRKPAVESLGLSQSSLASLTSHRYIRRFISRASLQEKSDKAWFNFGKPGRDPQKASTIFADIAVSEQWAPMMKIADIGTHWEEYVGQTIADNTAVLGFDNGVLTLQAKSTVWSTQLSYMVPMLKTKLSEQLSPVRIEKIVIKGPNSYTFKRGPYSVQGRGPRDTWG